MSGARPTPALGQASLAITALLAALLAANSLNTSKPGKAPAQAQQQAKPPAQTAEPNKPAPAQPLAVALPPPPAPTPKAVATPAPSPQPAQPQPLRVKPLASEPHPATPAPLVRQPLKPEVLPKPSPRRQPVAVPKAEPMAKPMAVAVTAETVTDGRTMLRLLEHGEGPGIEIAWPASTAERQRLYRLFRACFGMRTALIDDQGRLFVAESAPRTPWALDTDRFSGFMRQPDGALVTEERVEIERIQQRHGHHLVNPVRLFPRRLDAILLGGLRQAIGSEGTPGSGASIRARYRMAGDEVVVEDIRAGGRAVPGRINLSAAAGISGRACGI